MGIKTKKFDVLSTATDGKLILANDNKLYQSTSSLSEILEVSGGTSYEAGQGIKIDNNTISINAEDCITEGTFALAIGSETVSNGALSFAEGYHTSALNYASHAQGQTTLANGPISHAEGDNTSALGNASHAEGQRTIAGSNYMHVGGTYNATTANAYFVIGNGTPSERSDAFIVYPDGSVSAAGKISANGVELGAGGGGGDYVPLSAIEVNIGNDNTLTLTGLNKCILMQGSGNNIDTSYSTPAFIQGTDNTAMDASFCQGSGNNSQQRTLTQGKYNSGYYIALSQGETNKASYIAFSQGKSNSSYSASFAQGSGNSALCMGFAQGELQELLVYF